MKLEIRHLLAYLPYGLNMKRNGFIGILKQIKLPDKESLNEIYEFQVSCSNWWENADDQNHYKPILRPLSDLTKKIDGKNKTYLDHLNYETGINDEFVFADGNLLFIPDNDTEYNLLAIPYDALEFLKEHHFDIFGLIYSGLAVDINTLN